MSLFFYSFTHLNEKFRKFKIFIFLPIRDAVNFSRDCESVQRSRVVDFINQEVQTQRMTSQSMSNVQLVMDQFALRREFRHAIRGLIRARVDRYNRDHPRKPVPPVAPAAVPGGAEVPAPAPAVVEPPVHPEPVNGGEEEPVDEDVPPGQETLSEPCGNSTAFIDEHIAKSAEFY